MTTTPIPTPGHPPDGLLDVRELVITALAVLVGAGTVVQVTIPLMTALGLALAVLVGLALGAGAFSVTAAALHTVVRKAP